VRFVVIAGSVRSSRLGIRAARFVERSLASRGHEIALVDPMDVQLPLLDRPGCLARFTRFATEFAWYAAALKEARRAGVPF
jgi:NAD(P)H-dependent FMN reductase